MRRYRILMITHESLVPSDLAVLADAQDSITEYHVYSTLVGLGHHVRLLGIGDQLTDLRDAIRDWRPHVIFNLMEQFAGIVSYDYYVVAFLELMRQRYTGCNPRGLMLSRDKVLAKQVLAWHRVPTPAFHTWNVSLGALLPTMANGFSVEGLRAMTGVVGPSVGTNFTASAITYFSAVVPFVPPL